MRQESYFEKFVFFYLNKYPFQAMKILSKKKLKRKAGIFGKKPPTAKRKMFPKISSGPKVGLGRVLARDRTAGSGFYRI
jgi:hypothetical protein